MVNNLLGPGSSLWPTNRTSRYYQYYQYQYQGTCWYYLLYYYSTSPGISYQKGTLYNDRNRGQSQIRPVYICTIYIVCMYYDRLVLIVPAGTIPHVGSYTTCWYIYIYIISTYYLWYSTKQYRYHQGVRSCDRIINYYDSYILYRP